MTGGAEAEPCPPDSFPVQKTRRGESQPKYWVFFLHWHTSGTKRNPEKEEHTLCDENVHLPRLHGKERLVDGIYLNEDESPGGFGRLLVVDSHKLDPAT
jgi:hypothetical protein